MKYGRQDFPSCKLVLLSSLTSVLTALPALASQSYHIGNSLTWNSIQFTGFDHHGWSAHSLESIYNDPNASDFNKPEVWTAQLLQSYDVVTLQPHLSQGSTLDSDIAATTGFQNYAPHIDRWYLLQTWPQRAFWETDEPRDPNEYSDFWLSPNTTIGGKIATRQRRAYWDELIAATDAWIIPTGEIFYELEQAGYDVASFFVDNIHLNNSIGKLIAHRSLYITLNQTAVGALSTGDSEIDRIVWETIASHPQSGYSDYNRDGQIDLADLSTWESDYGSSRTSSDFLAWQRQLGNSTQTGSFVGEDADFNNDEEVNYGDLKHWESEYGTRLAGSDFLMRQRNVEISSQGGLVGLNAPLSTSVPEPCSQILWIICLITFGFPSSRVRFCRRANANVQEH